VIGAVGIYVHHLRRDVGGSSSSIRRTKSVVYKRNRDRPLRNAEQQRSSYRTVPVTTNELCAAIEVRSDPVDDDTAKVV